MTRKLNALLKISSQVIVCTWRGIPNQGNIGLLPKIFVGRLQVFHCFILFIATRGERFLGAGTCAEYNWSYGHCSESITPLEPATLYGTCKNSLQKILASFSESISLSSAWGRVFFLYGPYEYPARLVPAVMNSLVRGELALCSHGDQIRDFMHVSDVANAFVCLLESEVTGPVNIASGIPITIKDFVYKIADRINGRDMLKFGAFPTGKNEPDLLTADVSRLNK